VSTTETKYNYSQKYKSDLTDNLLIHFYYYYIERTMLIMTLILTTLSVVLRWPGEAAVAGEASSGTDDGLRKRILMGRP